MIWFFSGFEIIRLFAIQQNNLLPIKQVYYMDGKKPLVSNWRKVIPIFNLDT